MKQVLQDLRSGETLVWDIPVPQVKPGHVLVHTHRSLISSGTERMLVDFGRAGFIEKARQQPDKVRQVVDKVRTDGLAPTVHSVKSVGTVIAVGEGVEEFTPGDRVVSNGHHAEVVCVPVNLCARIPDGVTDEQASFTVLGAIALQGIRLAEP